MLWLDNRAGSKELFSPLKSLNLDVELTRLDFADIAFSGKGPEGAVDIGVEYKKLSELVQSMRSGRFEGLQYPGLISTYGSFAWLLIEGFSKADDQGVLCQWQGKQRGWGRLHGRMMASELEKRLLTLQLCGGLHIHRANSRRDTLSFLHNLYRWFTDAEFSKHRSHIAVYDAPTLVPVSATRAALMKLPGLGMKGALAAELQFKNLYTAVNATEAEWANLSTKDDKGHSRRLGEATARRIVDFCRRS